MWGHTSTTHNSSRGKLWYKVVYFYVSIALLFFYFFGEKQTHTTKGRGWDSNIKSQPQTYLKPLINKPCYFSCDKDIYPISRQQPKTSQIFLEGWSQSLNLSPSFVKLSKILNTIDKFFLDCFIWSLWDKLRRPPPFFMRSYFEIISWVLTWYWYIWRKYIIFLVTYII